MAQAPLKGPPPPHPPSPLSATAKSCSFWRTRALNIDWLQCGSIYLLKNGTVEISSFSQQPRGSVRTSFGCCSICLRKFLACGSSWAPTPTSLWLQCRPAKESRGGGEEELRRLRWFSPPKRSKNKLMAVLRWFLPRENSCIIIEQAKFKMLAMLINLNSPAPRNKITL